MATYGSIPILFADWKWYNCRECSSRMPQTICNCPGKTSKIDLDDKRAIVGFIGDNTQVTDVFCKDIGQDMYLLIKSGETLEVRIVYTEKPRRIYEQLIGTIQDIKFYLG